MLFSEPFFLFFFLPILLLVYLVTPVRFRNIVLSLASLVFYAMGEHKFIFWLLGSIAVNYWIAIGLDKVRGTPWSKPMLIVGLASDLMLFLVFKYADFAVININRLCANWHVSSLPLPGLLLPLGISFFTFHKMSYKIDVYRGTADVRRNPLDLALYILLFPQLIAGPIIRYHDIADQIVKRTLNGPLFARGVRRFIVGLGKKMIIANTAAVVADQVFAIPNDGLSPAVSWIGIVCYTLQIYFDFSGYSDMAIGIGHMFGFRFLENFNYPYVSKSITEFWRRWHISLSRWFRDYLYIPMGGNRKGPLRTYFNLVVIFFLCGLWHGASWHFVLWGMYHGVFLVIERLGFGKLVERLGPVRHVYTMLTVMVGWVLFRAESTDQAFAFLRAMFGATGAHSRHYSTGLYLTPEVVLTILIGIPLSLPIYSAVTRWAKRLQGDMSKRVRPAFALLSVSAEAAGLCCVFIYSSMLMAAGTYNPFIYFRF